MWVFQGYSEFPKWDPLPNLGHVPPAEKHIRKQGIENSTIIERTLNILKFIFLENNFPTLVFR